MFLINNAILKPIFSILLFYHEVQNQKVFSMIFPPLAKDLLFCLYSSTVKNKPDNQRGKSTGFSFH